MLLILLLLVAGEGQLLEELPKWNILALVLGNFVLDGGGWCGKIFVGIVSEDSTHTNVKNAALA